MHNPPLLDQTRQLSFGPCSALSFFVWRCAHLCAVDVLHTKTRKGELVLLSADSRLMLLYFAAREILVASHHHYTFCSLHYLLVSPKSYSQSVHNYAIIPTKLVAIIVLLNIYYEGYPAQYSKCPLDY